MTSAARDRVALVTGASGLLGGRVADRLLAMGIPTALHYSTNPQRPHEVTAQNAGLAMPVKADLADSAAVETMVADVRERFGPITDLVHCAAVTDDGLLIEQDEQRWRSVIEVNLLGTYRLVRGIVPMMMRKRAGRVVVVSSPSALHGIAGQSSYAASKAGVLGLIRALAVEYAARNITINAVCPGFMDSALTSATPEPARERILARTPLGKEPVDPDHVVDGIFFLLANPMVTGQNLVIDGGYTIS
ncbi:SDR family NAD(P)-dependent oxidoreductase [Nocardia brasiliensis]|uniref:SDR family NAD(P)-dependent oxidoreductase n=1 Tax=Nocardia brasiliensis TaxID=37326 RepID=UPI00366E1202